ncbi:HAMP domain-containing histidine kinase [Sediminibacterium roseum]|uniref:histidine kinase n=1 Tax=Sediminibacterium roseum TaxID=1978412 RepID=A0ABW9ZPX8_9BACT|nr:HAMP domain-containing sensor histidine kinase [Sediminibacterium roseum]NCI49135.1 HAMP domain-containing histidine kinase [Sediminibacterium roseum]
MKRTFLAIVILISLSLFGLILLQVSWFKNLLETTRTQYYNNYNQVAVTVANELYNTNNKQIIRLPKRSGTIFGTDPHLYHNIKPITVEQKFTQQEVSEMIRKHLERNHLKHVDFEFAIAEPNDEPEMASKNFYDAYWDTINNKRFIVPVIPINNNDIEIGAAENLVIMAIAFDQQIWKSLRWIVLGAGLFTIVIIAAFFVTVKSLLKQKKLSEIKSDFINNMTHEFKTPLATISLAVDALRNEKVQADREKSRYFSNIIKEENIRMNKHVETILQAALMDRQELQLNLKPIHIHELITDTVDTYELQLQEKGGEIQLMLNAKHDVINADEVHFTNLISNLVDNAIKYSKDKLKIIISTHSTKNNLVIRIEDNGIGMSKESVKRIFEKFYRAHTGNLHNVKGFGLGMSYVKTVIDAHKGKIKVESVLGKGSSFTIDVPLAEQQI